MHGGYVQAIADFTFIVSIPVVNTAQRSNQSEQTSRRLSDRFVSVDKFIDAWIRQTSRQMLCIFRRIFLRPRLPRLCCKVARFIFPFLGIPSRFKRIAHSRWLWGPSRLPTCIRTFDTPKAAIIGTYSYQYPTGPYGHSGTGVCPQYTSVYTLPTYRFV